MSFACLKKPDTITRLRNGEGLCTVCGQLGPVHRFVVVRKHTYPRCEEGCEYDNGNPSRLITWQDVEDGLSISECEWKWLEQHHPEVIAAAEGKGCPSE